MELNHIDEKNNPTMVDVSPKQTTIRVAHAQTIVKVPPILQAKLVNNEMQSKKGPVFHTAIIAGTMAVKRTHELIPFCHPLNIESIKIDITPKHGELIIECRVKISGKTGVEMEALTGATVTALTVYDMCKAVSHEMVIGETKLIAKSGGKRIIEDGQYVEG